MFQLIYLTNLIFNSNSVHLVHKSNLWINYQIELLTSLPGSLTAVLDITNKEKQETGMRCTIWVSAAKQHQPRQLWDDCFFDLKDSYTWSKQRQYERNDTSNKCRAFIKNKIK
jgi:hypothetical protein